MRGNSELDVNQASCTPSWQIELGPSEARARQIDHRLRVRLADSLEYLGRAAGVPREGHSGLDELIQRVRNKPISPWVSCLYSRVVYELSRTPRGDVEGAFDDLFHSGAASSEQGIIALRSPLFEERWWDHFQVVLDTDRKRPFMPKSPNPESFSRSAHEVGAALELLQEVDPAWHAELATLLRMIVLAVPASERQVDGFNGASTFFLWGAAILNAEPVRSVMSMVDVLVHEGSHLLLFGLSAEGPLMRNSGGERYASPVRADERPIEGIFHACFVTTRVHCAFGRMLESGRLSDDIALEATERRRANGEAALISLQLLNEHMEPTEIGARIYGRLQEYWTRTKPA